jgi:ribulose 1,5-bisphosphate synthetase/thiazole synthase
MAIYGWALTKLLGQHITRVLISGGGFAGLNAAKVFAGAKGIELIIIDQKN